MPKPVREVDGERFSTLEGFFDEFERRVIPGYKWGRNLDGLEDVLDGGFGTPPDGFVLRWRAADSSRERLGYAETVRQLERRLDSCHPSNRPSIERSIEAARRSEGPTVFDWLTGILSEHPAVDLSLE